MAKMVQFLYKGHTHVVEEGKIREIKEDDFKKFNSSVVGIIDQNPQGPEQGDRDNQGEGQPEGGQGNIIDDPSDPLDTVPITLNVKPEYSLAYGHSTPIKVTSGHMDCTVEFSKHSDNFQLVIKRDDINVNPLKPWKGKIAMVVKYKQLSTKVMITCSNIPSNQDDVEILN